MKIVDFKLGQGVEFKVSKEEVKDSAIHMSLKEKHLKGYFVEIDGKEYRMMSLVDQLCKDKGLEISKVDEPPYEIGTYFEKLGFRSFRRIPLSSAKNIFLLQNIHNAYNFGFINPHKIHSDRLMIGKYEFTGFKIINLEGLEKMTRSSYRNILKKAFDEIEHPENIFLDRIFVYLDTYEKAELKSGLLLVTSDAAEDQKILFLFYDEDLKKFMDDLLEVIKVIDDLLSKSLLIKEKASDDDQKHFEESLKDQMAKLEEQEINPMSAIIGLEMINAKYNPKKDEATVFSLLGGIRYNFYYHLVDGIDKKEMKALLEVAKPSGNRKIKRSLKMAKDKDAFDWQEEIYKLNIVIMGAKTWRKILINPKMTFVDLSKIINSIMDWDDGHSHAFYIAGFEIKNESLEINRFLIEPKNFVIYFYDSREVKVYLEKILDRDSNIHYPICTMANKPHSLKDSNDQNFETVDDVKIMNEKLIRIFKDNT
ncbi:MAG: plasmid pRiA4b ORF-3 family protein [Thermotogae bacterium]|jgi:hypothetical protein|nr:plasmid pRiA4b ORF-3 family protein [Thermotogota bacterium]MCL5031868.1 plasmid pRiA4b ORF-3 family protein [Thermotogota bacterium]